MREGLIASTVRLVRTGWREFGSAAALFLVVALGVGFGLLAEEVMEGDTAQFDLAVLSALRTPGPLSEPIGPPWLQEMGRDVTALGSFAFLGFVFVAVAGYLFLIGKRGLALLMSASVLGGMTLSTVLKYAFDRPRPDLTHAARVFTPSFPSGHATLATITFLTIGVLLVRATADSRAKTYFMSLAVFLTVAVGFSRMYLGVHYPSDVLAGWSVGAAWTILCWSIAFRLQQRGQLDGAPVGP